MFFETCWEKVQFIRLKDIADPMFTRGRGSGPECTNFYKQLFEHFI